MQACTSCGSASEYLHDLRPPHRKCGCAARVCGECRANMVRHRLDSIGQRCATHQSSEQNVQDVVTASDPATRFYALDPLLRRELYRYTVPPAPPPSILQKAIPMSGVHMQGNREVFCVEGTYADTLRAMAATCPRKCLYVLCDQDEQKCLWHR